MQGINIFRMARDDLYLHQMLTVLSRFYTTFVLPGKQPPADIFADLPEHQSFLASSLRVARSTAVMSHVSSEMLQTPPGADHRPFLA